MDERGVAEVEAECDGLAMRLTGLVAADARRGCPVDTGELLASIHEAHHALMVGRVYVGTDHWWPTEYGSRPHDIRARNPNGALHFFWEREGRDVFFRSVHHPGTPAQPFMRPAVYMARVL
jgi:hypothetical protein